LTNALGDNTSGFLLALFVNLEYQFQIPEVTGGVRGGEGAGDILGVALDSSDENRRNILAASVSTSSTPHIPPTLLVPSRNLRFRCEYNSINRRYFFYKIIFPP
jgi:hypothetical protein